MPSITRLAVYIVVYKAERYPVVLLCMYSIIGDKNMCALVCQCILYTYRGSGSASATHAADSCPVGRFSGFGTERKRSGRLGFYTLVLQLGARGTSINFFSFLAKVIVV